MQRHMQTAFFVALCVLIVLAASQVEGLWWGPQ